MSHETNFAALIGSRICHDLISPIGAINNGIELIQMMTPSLGPEMELIADSVTHASARVRFFRVAFGAAGEQLVGKPEVSSILKDVFSDSRLTVVLGEFEGQQRRKVRLTFLALLCMETSMPFGGRIEVAQSGDAVVLTGYADKFKADPELWGALGGAPLEAELRPAQVQFGLLPLFAAEDNIDLSVDITDEQIVIRL